jgi:hypothetical protein
MARVQCLGQWLGWWGWLRQTVGVWSAESRAPPGLGWSLVHGGASVGSTPAVSLPGSGVPWLVPFEGAQ